MMVLSIHFYEVECIGPSDTTRSLHPLWFLCASCKSRDIVASDPSHDMAYLVKTRSVSNKYFLVLQLNLQVRMLTYLLTLRFYGTLCIQ